MKNKWEKVGKVCYMPEPGARVLVMIDGEMAIGYFDSGDWYDSEYQDLKNVTHWRKLPRGPKKDSVVEGLLAMADERIRELEEPIIDFINKVDSGRAKSTDSYNKFKAVMKNKKQLNQGPC